MGMKPLKTLPRSTSPHPEEWWEGVSQLSFFFLTWLTFQLLIAANGLVERSPVSEAREVQRARKKKAGDVNCLQHVTLLEGRGEGARPSSR